jgi:hypothetical protein
VKTTAVRPWLLTIVVVIAIGAVLAGILGDRYCREPVDVSGTTELLGWLTALKSRDELAYPAHTLLGTLLNDRGCSPTAAGLQWIKAGAHARTEHEVAAAGQGLAVARTRASQTEAFDAALCGYVVNGFANTQQEAVARRADVRCTPP